MAKEFINKEDISDALIERPVGFSIKDRHFSVYPASLGKIQLTARLIDVIGLADLPKREDVHLALYEAARKHREECIRFISYSTLPGADCLDESKVGERMKELEAVDEVDIANVLFVVLTQDKTALLMKQFGIDLESKRIEKVMKIKKADKNTMSFGGRSVWGTLIDTACERYGWSYQYVLWGISYCNLQMLLSDQVRTVFLSDQERKLVHVSNDSVVVRADDVSKLNEFIKTQSWK